MRWRPLFAQYAWIIAWREVLRSERWTDEEKGLAMAVAVMIASIPVVVALTAIAVVWLLTGRGPGRWMLGQAFVNPFPKRGSDRYADAASRALKRRSEERASEA
jgi:hypothetical protein